MRQMEISTNTSNFFAAQSHKNLTGDQLLKDHPTVRDIHMRLETRKDQGEVKLVKNYKIHAAKLFFFKIPKMSLILKCDNSDAVRCTCIFRSVHNKRDNA